MAKVYTGGTVIGAPQLTHSQAGTAQLTFRIRDEREAGGKVYVDEAVVEMWGAVAEKYANELDEGTVVKAQGFARADGHLSADGKPYGVLVVKAGREGDLEVVSRPQVTAAQAAGVADDDDPFADQ